MGYYQSGDYYGGGDYYAAGGLFGFLGKVAKGVAGTALGIGKAAFAASPVGAAITGITSAVTPTGFVQQPTSMPQITPPPMAIPKSPLLGLPVHGGATQQAAGRGGNVLIGGKWFHYNKHGELKKGKRPTMNVGNVKALRRSDRRIDRFVGVARSALKHTNYKVVSRSSGRGGGSRGVITRSEAARALRR